MAAIARVLSRASGTEVDIETLKTIVIFCGVGLAVSLLLAGAVDSLRLAPDINELDIIAWIWAPDFLTAAFTSRRPDALPAARRLVTPKRKPAGVTGGLGVATAGAIFTGQPSFAQPCDARMHRPVPLVTVPTAGDFDQQKCRETPWWSAAACPGFSPIRQRDHTAHPGPVRISKASAFTFVALILWSSICVLFAEGRRVNGGLI
jgi:hypothetical protein